jgi:hypothetical protein
MDEAPVVDVPGSETWDSVLEERMTDTAGTASARFWTHGVPYDGFPSQPPYWARAKARAGCGCDVLSSSFHPRVSSLNKYIRVPLTGLKHLAE